MYPPDKDQQQLQLRRSELAAESNADILITALSVEERVSKFGSGMSSRGCLTHQEKKGSFNTVFLDGTS